MSTRTAVRAITLTIAVALTVIAINLQADIASPVFPPDTVMDMQATEVGKDAEFAVYPPEPSINWQLCPC